MFIFGASDLSAAVFPHTVLMYMSLGTRLHAVDSDQATRHGRQKIATTTAPAFPCLSHTFFPGTIEETYNEDSTISIYLKEIFFYLHLLPEKHNPILEYYTSTNKIRHVK